MNHVNDLALTGVSNLAGSWSAGEEIFRLVLEGKDAQCDLKLKFLEYVFQRNQDYYYLLSNTLMILVTAHFS